MNNEVTFLSTTNMFIEKEGKVLLMKRSESLADFPGWYILPGGKQEKSETVREAAIREVFEETGIKVKDANLKIVATHDHEYKNKVYIVNIFVAEDFDGELMESKEGTPQWIEIEKAFNSAKLYPDLKRHIKLIQESKTNEVLFTYHRFDERLNILESR